MGLCSGLVPMIAYDIVQAVEYENSSMKKQNVGAVALLTMEYDIKNWHINLKYLVMIPWAFLNQYPFTEFFSTHN